MRPRRRFLQPRLEHLEDRRVLACQVFVREQTLVVLGGETDNLVEIVADGRSLAVACDGVAAGTFTEIRAVQLLLAGGQKGLRFNAEEALGPGAIKDTDGDGLPEIVDGFGSVTFFEFISGAGAQRFDIGPAAENGSFQMDVADADDGFHRMRFRGFAVEAVTVKAGDGDDEFDMDVNEDGLVNPIDLIGDGGNDKLTINASHLAELIEIAGVIQQQPDPLIRGTNIATGAAMFEVSVFETESIMVDTRGGDDQVVMRELQAPLSDVDWTIMTRGGNDTVDVQMAALPGVFHVLTGGGDDDVSIVFGGGFVPPTSDLRPLTSEANALVPKIDVDVGAGVDAVLLDVFGSLQPPPPSDLGEISVQVTLQEVLASIFITGVGLLALETLFPLGALEMAQAIKDDRAGHTRSEVSLLLDGKDLTADVSTHATLDSILIGLSPVPESKIALNLNTGAEDDKIDIRSTSRFGTFQSFIELGQGHDLLRETFDEAGAPGGAPAPLPPSFVEQTILGDGGNDVIDVLADVGPGQYSFEIDAGDGDNGATLRFGDGTQGKRLPTGSSLNAKYRSGNGSDNVTIDYDGPLDLDLYLDVNTGGGNDDVAVRVTNPAPSEGGQEPESPDEARRRAAVSIDSGGGDDRVTVNLPAVQTDGLADLIVGADAGAGPHVKVFDGGTNAEVPSFFAHPPVPVLAVGDVNGDGIGDVIIASGPGDPPLVTVIDGDRLQRAEPRSFFAYGTEFTGGVFVASGDVNGDGRADIITGAGQGAPGGHVKVVDGKNLTEMRSFFAFPGFQGGVRVAAGDVNGDGRDDIIVGAGPGAPGGHVKIFDGVTNQELASFFAYGQFAGGVFVAAGDVNNDGRDDIVTGTDSGTAAHVKVFSGATLQEVRSFLPYGPNFTGGVRVAAGDVNGDGFADIVTGAGPGAGPHVKVFDGQTNAEVRSFFAFPPNFTGGVFVAAGDLHASAQPKRLNLDLAIDTHGGADAVAVHLSAAATEERIEKVRINTGAGLDNVQLDVFYPVDPCRIVADYGIETGGDDDTVNFELLTAPGQPIGPNGPNGPNGPEPQQLNVTTRINTNGGNDKLNFDWLVHTDRQLTSAIEVLTGAGNDMSRFKIAESFAPRPRDRVFTNYDYFHDAGSGHDDVQFQILPFIEQDNIYRFRFELGAGNDKFQGFVFGTELPAVQLNEQFVMGVSVAGQQGNDNIAFVWADLLQANQIQANQSALRRRQISLDLDGGHGNDNLSLDFQGTILDDEAVDAVLRGGEGQDVVEATLNLDPRSTGRLRAEVHGDGGNDDLELLIFGDEHLAELLALLDGGPGRDKCQTTPNVVVRNCP